MAHITKEETKNIREKLKKEFPTYKFSVRNADNSEVIISLLKSDLDLEADMNNINCSDDSKVHKLNGIAKGFLSINHYCIDRNWKGKTLDVLTKILEIAKSQNWYDKSDSQRDYFDTAYYININIGTYEKRYEKL